MLEYESPKLLVERAKENYADFTEKRKVYFESRKAITFKEIDPNTGEDVYKIRLKGEMAIPGAMRAAVSDTLNNLRHALDQSIYATRSVLNPDAKGDTYFPICKELKDFDRTIKDKCSGVHPNIIKYVKSLKPYNGGDDLLWQLCKITGENKHRIVLGVDISVQPVSYVLHVDVGSGKLGGFIRCGDKYEWEIARMEPGTKLRTEYRVTKYITFASGDVIKGQVVSRVLDEHIRKVEQIVSTLESETMCIKDATA